LSPCDILEAIDETTVRPEAHLLHDIFQGDEIFDVEIWLVDELLRCWVEIDVKT